MQPDLTIAVCAHNAADRLPLAMRAIAACRARAGRSWEVLVIDNASTDRTADVARSFAEQLGASLRVLREPTAGLIHARTRAAAEARGPILSYIDDDNVVGPDWVDACLDFFEAHPHAGIIGGRIDPVFEDPASRPADFDANYAGALAIRDLGPAPLRLRPPQDDPPCGAGMTGRTPLLRQVLLDVGCRLSGRKGDELTAGEDTEIGLLAHKLGWELWYAPALTMGHLLPKSRLTQEYLDKLIAGGARSGPWLDFLRGKEPRRGRAAYLAQWAGHRAVAVRLGLVARLRGAAHPNAARFAFWTQLHRARAAGYLEMALTDAPRKVDAALARHGRRAEAPPACPPEAPVEPPPAARPVTPLNPPG